MNCLIGIALFAACVQDIKYRKVSLWILVTYLVLAFLYQASQNNMSTILFDIIPGVLLSVLSVVCNKSIGLADGLLSIAYGILLGWWKVCVCLCLSFWTAAITGVIFKLYRKNVKSLPFVPFLFIGHVGLCL